MKLRDLCSKLSILITVQVGSSSNTLGKQVNSRWSLDLIEGSNINALDLQRKKNPMSQYVYLSIFVIF